MLEVSLLAICYTIYTSSQRTEAGFGGISWAFPLVEGGETLPSSCSPLLATFDIAREQGQVANFDLYTAPVRESFT